MSERGLPTRHEHSLLTYLVTPSVESKALMNRHQENMHRKLLDSSSSCIVLDNLDNMKEPHLSSNNFNDIAAVPQKHFWRRFFRLSPGSSSGSFSSKRSKRKKRNSQHADDEKSSYSSSSSSQSGSDNSEPSRKQNREQRVAKYLSIDTGSTPCQPISMISDEGDLTLWRSSCDSRQEASDDDYEEESTADDCRDDVGLLNDPRVLQSHLLHTPTALKRQTTGEEDRVALLSEHDDLLENRRGSYNVDCVDHLAISGAAALQKLSLLTLSQELVACQDQLNRQMERMFHKNDPVEVLTAPLTIAADEDDQDDQPAPVPLQIEFPSGETTEGVVAVRSPSPRRKKTKSKSKSRSKSKISQSVVVSPSSVDESIEIQASSSSTALNPLGEEPPAYSEIIQDRTQRHKAFYLLRLRNSQKKSNAAPRPSPHGDLFTLAELPSEDESSRFSQISGNFSALQRSGSGSAGAGSKKMQHIMMEDQVALIGSC